MDAPPECNAPMPAVTADIQIHRTVHLGKKLWLISIGTEQYLVGAEICNVYRKETFNVYRSLKVRGAGMLRGTSDMVDHLIRQRVLKTGTRSVTLVPYHETLAILDAPPSVRGRPVTKAIPIPEESQCDDSSSSCHEEDPQPWIILANMVNSTCV